MHTLTRWKFGKRKIFTCTIKYWSCRVDNAVLWNSRHWYLHWNDFFKVHSCSWCGRYKLLLIYYILSRCFQMNRMGKRRGELFCDFFYKSRPMRREDLWCAAISLVKTSAKKFIPALNSSSKNTDSGQVGVGVVWD